MGARPRRFENKQKKKSRIRVPPVTPRTHRRFRDRYRVPPSASLESAVEALLPREGVRDPHSPRANFARSVWRCPPHGASFANRGQLRRNGAGRVHRRPPPPQAATMSRWVKGRHRPPPMIPPPDLLTEPGTGFANRSCRPPRGLGVKESCLLVASIRVVATRAEFSRTERESPGSGPDRPSHGGSV